jgi:branched-chain amino acid transport system substrate-binding protein
LRRAAGAFHRIPYAGRWFRGNRPVTGILHSFLISEVPELSRDRIARKTFIAASAGAVAVASFPVFLPKRSAAEDFIQIGVSEEITGVYAEPARNEIRGMQMAVDQQNKSGGVLSRQVKLIIEDNANNPGTAVEKARKLIQVDKVNALIGTVNSANSQATSNVCLEATIPFIDTGGHTDSVTGKDCHWTSFRTCHSTWMETHATGYSIASKLGKKWYYLAPDYAFGHSLLDGYKDIERKLGVTVVGEDLAPLGTTDYSAYLTKVLNAKPDVLVVMQQGQDLINCLKQANSLGLLKRVAVAGPQGEIENFWSLPKEARVGYWGFEWYYKSALVTGKNRAAGDFIKTYTGMFKQPPTARSVFGYVTAERMMAAMTKAKGTDAVKVSQAISGEHFTGLWEGDAYYRDVDHQLIWPMWFGQVRPDGKNGDEWDIFEVVDAQQGDKVEKPADEQKSVCKLNYPA